MSEEWKKFIEEELKKEYMMKLKTFVDDRRKKTSVLPEAKLTFNCFSQCKYEDLKVIILGDEPIRDSNGLAFSTLSDHRPEVLINIYQEIWSDFFVGNTGNVQVFRSNDLTQWARQGVLLLNRVLTVDEGKPGSHAGKGWEIFVENAIKFINTHNHKLVFMLWGKEAKAYEKFIGDRHLILKSEHPGIANQKQWLGNKNFTKSNEFIKKHYFNIKPMINWGVYRK